ncbi:hypothetical protein ACHAWO_012760 [Cyclotella atomus]|jgi:ankyrin repeat protein|uniref:Ankyrin repeat domain-containing protein n=1 Tax=Cyclotella atomus TaxID=382360 RepID=A0ABD3NBR1_9STRA
MGTIEKLEVPEYLRGENQWETEANLELFQAAQNGDIEMLKVALAKGGNPNYFSVGKDGTLHAASRNASGDAALCARELVQSGARVSAALISNRNTALHEAASFGVKEVVEVLVETSPESTELANSYGNTPLHAASAAGKPEIVKLLLENEADPNKINHRGSTALHSVSALANDSRDDPYIKIAAILLSNEKTMVDIQDINGYTPLHLAAQRGSSEMVRLLIDSGSSLTIKTGIDSKGRGGRIPEMSAQFGGFESTAQLIREFTEALGRGETVATKKMALQVLEKL